MPSISGFDSHLVRPIGRLPWRIDASSPLLIFLGAFLCGLVLLPLGWLGWYSITDAKGALSLANFARLATDQTFIRPYLTALIVAASVAAGASLVATPLAWLVARTDLPLRRTIRALVTASFVTPPFLGAIAWEILAAPNSGILNQWYRALFGLGPYEHLFNIYTAEGLVFVMACYSFPYVFVLVANALDNIPAELEDASAILGGRRSRDIAAGDPANGVAGSPRRRARRLSAGADSVRDSGDPRSAGRLPCHHDQDLGALPVPAEPASGRSGGAAAAAPDHPIAARAAMAARPARLCRDRRQERHAAAGWARHLALARPALRHGGPRPARSSFPTRR